MSLACELPQDAGVPVSQWDCKEIARELVGRGAVESISHETVRRILKTAELKPWQVRSWLTPRLPWDEQFKRTVADIVGWYTKDLSLDELVLCFDEKTSIQPRPRTSPSQAAAPGRPVRMEAEYERAGALNLLAFFDTRSGVVHGWVHERKRAAEFLATLDALDERIPPSIRRIVVVLDNLRVHKGKAAEAWLAAHPRFVFQFTPVHCSWLNQVEQWFGILQRKLLANANVPSRDALATLILAYVERWNAEAHPFNWHTGSAARILAAPAARRAVA